MSFFPALNINNINNLNNSLNNLNSLNNINNLNNLNNLNNFCMTPNNNIINKPIGKKYSDHQQYQHQNYKKKYKTEKCKFWEISETCKFGDNVRKN